MGSGSLLCALWGDFLSLVALCGSLRARLECSGLCGCIVVGWRLGLDDGRPDLQAVSFFAERMKNLKRLSDQNLKKRAIF